MAMKRCFLGDLWIGDIATNADRAKPGQIASPVGRPAMVAIGTPLVRVTMATRLWLDSDPGV